jgi:SAM-dependent methyltransferase
VICRFCGQPRLKEAFKRQGRRYVRCRDCRAIQQPIDQSTLNAVREMESFDDRVFLRDLESVMGTVPDRRRFREFQDRLPPGRLLEVGPGTGHFLAAAREAGYQIECVEISPTVRAYLREHWGIVAHEHPLEENLLPADTFDCVVSFNCIEHVLEPVAHLKSVRRVLRPGGVFLFTTCNAECLVEKVFGGFWSMFKPPDHVSIGCAKSFSRAAELAGLQVRRISYSEYAFETPIGLATAARDFIQEKLLSGSSPTQPAPATGSSAPLKKQSPAKAMLRRFLSFTNSFDQRFSPALLTRLMGVTGAIRIELQRPES